MKVGSLVRVRPGNRWYVSATGKIGRITEVGVDGILMVKLPGEKIAFPFLPDDLVCIAAATGWLEEKI